MFKADCFLSVLAKGLQSTSGGHLCLYGKPDAGKTAFAHHLGQTLDRPVLVKRGSDLLGMFVGQSEAQIAAAFREARGDNTILVIDEADGHFARSNRRATSLGNHPGQRTADPDGGVRRHLHRIHQPDRTLNAASLPRFAFKVKFDSLNSAQRRALVAKVCAVSVDSIQRDARTLLDRLGAITPGDVAVPLRQCRISARTPSVETLVHLLAAEQGMKPECRQLPMGFIQ